MIYAHRSGNGVCCEYIYICIYRFTGFTRMLAFVVEINQVIKSLGIIDHEVGMDFDSIRRAHGVHGRPLSTSFDRLSFLLNFTIGLSINRPLFLNRRSTYHRISVPLVTTRFSFSRRD